jgi:hypothetical protein
VKIEPHPKLATAFASLSVLFLAQFIFLFSHDLFKDTPPYPNGLEEQFNYSYWNEIGNLFVVCLFAVPMLIWHVSDMMASREPETRLGRRLLSYGAAFGAMLFGLAGYAIIASGITERMQCWEADRVNSIQGNDFFVLCHPESGYLIEFFVLPFLLALVVLAITKLAFAILNLSGKPV